MKIIAIMLAVYGSVAVASPNLDEISGLYNLQDGTAECEQSIWVGTVEHPTNESTLYYSITRGFPVEIFVNDLNSDGFVEQLHTATPKVKATLQDQSIITQLRGINYCVFADAITVPCGIARIRAESVFSPGAMELNFSGFYTDGANVHVYGQQACSYSKS